MAFFDDPEPPTLPQRPSRPAWFGPPEGEVAALVPARLVVARSRHAAVLLSHIDVFSTGCTLRVRVVVRRPDDLDEAAWRERQHVLHRSHPLHDLAREGSLRFGVLWADGARAVAGTRTGHDRHEMPRQPVLHLSGGGGSGGDSEVVTTLTLWHWPLPPAEPFDLVVDWTDEGIDETRVELDGATIRAAATEVAPLF